MSNPQNAFKPAEPEGFVDATKVALLFGTSKNFVFDHAKRGTLPSYSLGRSRRFKVSEVLAWAEQRRQEGADE